ncbi:MAG: nitronate monooxygenase [Paraburkholderia sp.]|nr:nitronate monooxygenase [Paraburkholderia sp.]
MISTRFTERFGIKHPIICAPMAFVTGGALVAAVYRAGGLGIVGGGYAGTLGGEPDLETELSQVNAGKFGVGFITWALARAPEMQTKALRHSPSCVFLSLATLVRSQQKSATQAPRSSAWCSSCRRST